MAIDALFGSGSFHAGGLNPTETEFAKEVSAFEGLSFQGSTRGAQGLDGFLYQGNFAPTNIKEAVELQQNSSGGERRILEDAENHEYSAAQADRKNLSLYIKTTDKNVTVQSVNKFISDWGDGGLRRLVNKGTIKQITIFTQNGVVRIEKGHITSIEKQ